MFHNREGRPPNADQRRLQIILPEGSVYKLDEIKEALEAASYSEVVRRAIWHLCDLLEQGNADLPDLKPAAPNRSSDARSKMKSARIQIVLPPKTYDRLEVSKEKLGSSSLASVVRMALSTYWAFLRNPRSDGDDRNGLCESSSETYDYGKAVLV